MRTKSLRRSTGVSVLLLSLLGTSILGAGCSSRGPAERVSVRTSNLSRTQSLSGEPQQVYAEARTWTNAVTTGIGLTPLALVESPVLEGTTLQATDVQWAGHYVYASYNVQGEAALGALQVIDAQDPRQPRVVAEAIYQGTELARIRVSGARILAAGADPAEGGTLELFSFEDGTLRYDGYERVGSFAATFLELSRGKAYLSYGDRGGGVSVYDVTGAKPVFSRTSALEDARWVTPLDGDATLAIAGSPARLVKRSPAGAAEGEKSIDGAQVGAPTWGTRHDDLLFVSADAAGLLVYDVRTLAPIGSLATHGDANGADIAGDGRIAFLANGQEGLVVVDIVDPRDPKILASIDVGDDAGSANAVAVSGENIALADGLGGVKLLEYKRTVEAPGDCDGDGKTDDVDTDDDDDGVLDTEDAATCNPDVVCPPDKMDYSGKFVGDFFNLPCDHKDMEGPITGVLRGTLPNQFDWYDPKYHVFTVERESLVIKYSSNYFPVDTGLCGDPFYFAAHWHTTAVVTEAGKYRVEMGSDDDSWLFVDGRLVKDLGGVHALVRESAEVTLSAGAHQVDIYFAERHKTQSGLEFEFVGVPSPTARVHFVQHQCLDPKGDEDGDGIINEKDIAPLYR